MNGVFTSDDFAQKRKVEKKKGKIKVRNPSNLVVSRKYFNPMAPKGESSNFLTYEKKSVKLTLKDGIFIPPKQWSNKRKREIGEMLLKDGFEDVSEIKTLHEKIERKSKDENLEYVLLHPDSSSDRSEWKIRGDFAVNVIGKDGEKEEVKVSCINNVIKVYDENVRDAFVKKNWAVMGVNKIKDIEEKTSKENK